LLGCWTVKAAGRAYCSWTCVLLQAAARVRHMCGRSTSSLLDVRILSAGLAAAQKMDAWCLPCLLDAPHGPSLCEPSVDVRCCPSWTLLSTLLDVRVECAGRAVSPKLLEA
ncbi:hypothetical protein VIGAN_10130900, partial [Vigna angularis var. angularis]